MEKEDPSWKAAILSSLFERDIIEKSFFTDIFTQYNSNKDLVLYLKGENTRLVRELTSCQQEKSAIQLELEKIKSVKSYDYEQKVFHLQEEVTELHRQKGSLAQNVIDLNRVLQEKDTLLQSKSLKISELEDCLKANQAQNHHLMERVKELEETKELLTDEQASHLLTTKALETKNRQLEDDNLQLMKRIKALQSTVERLKNIEYDVQYRKAQETIRKNLQDAVNSTIFVTDSDCSDKPLPCKSALPRNVAVKIDANENEVNSVRFTPSGHIFGSAGFDRKLRLWTYLNGKCEIHSTLVGCNAAVTAIDFDPNETAVLGASSDFSCRVWTLNDSRLRVNLTGHSERVISAKFMGSANRVVTASSDRTIKIWDVDKCCCRRTIMAASTFQDVVVCPSMSALVTGHFDQHLRIWDERSGENTNKILLSGRITGMDISSDFTTVLACTRNNTLEIVDLRTNQVTQCLKADGFQTGLDIVRPCFSPDSDYVAAGGHDGGVYIWSTVSGNLEICLRDHTNIVVCCHWNPNGNSLVSCERIKKAIVWSSL
ncbi:family S9 non-peptidase homologue (S09 family) [Schistosoma mansoni]|uniref:Autophagy-related protein 16 domain-containing protein n=1 Tax=Schistosoma mansoni TaxID=6183 RepID=A0A5K4FED0_SCHMA|nr:family S9 non-peptidase homologue (S09 family) [Schistosoma mansoni]|eukprot:XP_018648039.1 family S9 non-peptidase homologue (S09 family) [Schistosoma mansoni]